MRHLPRSGVKLTVLAALAFGLIFGVGGVGSQGLHGIGTAKTCEDPTVVGQPLLCELGVTNFDTAGHPVKVFSLGDVVQSFGGAVDSGNIMTSKLKLVFNPATGPNAPFCVGGSGAGTPASPYTGATECTLPVAGSSIQTLPFTHYTVLAADYNLPNHRLTDQGQFGWRDTCLPDPTGCNTNNQVGTAPGSTRVIFQPSIATSVNGNATTVIRRTGTAFDTATLSGMSPDAGGTVNYKLYTDATCTTLATNPALDQTVTVTNGVVPNSQTLTFNVVGKFWFQATYSGDANNIVPAGGLKSVCTSEPLTVVDARISLTPSGTNKVGTAHTFTVFVEKNDATGWTPAAGAPTFTSESGVGAITGGTCGAPATGPTNASGQCTIIVNSAVVGTSTVFANSFVTVLGVGITASTFGYGAVLVQNQKTWVDARITIATSGANKVGNAHTFTVTVQKNSGSGFVAAPGVNVTPSISGLAGASITGGTCGSVVTNASGQCTVIVNSTTVGTATVNASATVSVAGGVGSANVDVATNGYGAFNISNQKTWVDARISITPSGTNQVNTAHTFTVKVEKNDGTGWTPAVGASTFSSESGVGAITGGTCGSPATGPTNASGQCTVIVNSATPGTSSVFASSIVNVLGVNITVETFGYGAFTVENKKTWVDARISIVESGTNQVNSPHTFTVTVEKNSGSGFVAASGVNVTPSIGGLVGATITGGTCGSVATNALGQCTIVVNSTATGTATVNASATVNVAGVVGNANVAVSTTGYGAFTVHNQKTWVDARISIVESGTNQVNSPHTFTVTVQKNSGSGFVAAAGVTVTPTIGGLVGASITGGTCGSGPTDGLGQCTVIVNSTATGTATVNASATVNVAGAVGSANVAVSTTGYGAFTVHNQKTWVDARISIVESGTNQVNSPHTFTVTVEKNSGSGFVAASGVNVTPSISGLVGASITGGTCGSGPTNASGQCTVIVNSTATGTATVNASATVNVAGAVGSANVAVSTTGYGAFTVHNQKTWVDARISIVESGTNQVNSPHTFTVTVEKNSGSGFVAASGVNVTPSISGLVGASITGGTCGSGPTNASGQCTVIVNSTATGTATVNASATVNVAGAVGSANVAVSTTGYGAFTVHNQKTWVDARISIIPFGTNEVGDPHTFTVTVEKNSGGGFAAAAGVTVSSSITGVGSITGGTCTTGPTNASGQCTVIVNSATPGLATVDVSANVTVAGAVGSAVVAVSSTGYGAFVVENQKRWADARISIVESDTNQVNDPHTFTVTVEKNSGAGWVAAAGVAVTPSHSGAGSITGGTCGTVVTDASGQCTVIVNSATTGTATVHASASVHVTGPGGTFVDIPVSTSGAGAFTVHNQKTWVDARISITPTDVNEVTSPHTFTVKVEKDLGTGTFVAAAGVSVTSTELGIGSITGGTCGPTGPTNAAGECTVVVNSSSPGVSTVHASGTVSVGGVSILVATNGYGAFTVENQKTWVDAYIEISPLTKNNPVNSTHTYTAHVFVNNGGGGGYVDAPNGTVVTFAFVGAHVGSFSGADNCTITNGLGTCTVDTTSATAGTDTMQASSTLSVLGVSMTRTTGQVSVGHVNGGNATKLWGDVTVRTDIHNPNHDVVLSVNAGTVVHDKVFVARTAGTPAAIPNPTGQVTFHRYSTIDCTGAAVDETVTLPTDETGTFAVQGPMSYRADYLGDANYPAKAGACEPLEVNIQLPCPAGLFLAGKSTAGSVAGDIKIAYDQFPAPNDVSYGTNAVGWSHTFGNLTGSDKAGFQVIRPDGTIAVSFNIDTISAKAGTPSGYASLGPFGGDGDIVANSVPPLTNVDGKGDGKIEWDHSAARNLNGVQSPFGTYSAPTYFTGGVQTIGTSGTNSASLLVNSPPVDCSLATTPGTCLTIFGTPKGSQYPLAVPNPWTASYDNPEYATIPVGSSQFESHLARHVDGWNFHNTFFVTLKQTYLTALGFNFASWETAQFNAATNTAACSARGPSAPWCVSPNTTVLHNSPAKPCPVAPPTPISPSDVTVGTWALASKTVKMTLTNSNASSDTVITDILNLQWPVGNGNLVSVKLDGDTVWSGTQARLAGGVPNLAAVAGWTSNVSRRTLDNASSEVLVFTFQNNAVGPLTTGYTGQARFDDTFNKTILPQP